MKDMHIKLKKINCANCNVLFYIEEGHNDRLLASKNTFYCPNGHRQSYEGKTDKEKLEDSQEENNNFRRDLHYETLKVNKLNKELNIKKREIVQLKKKPANKAKKVSKK